MYHVIINALKNVPEPTLIFAAQAPSSLSCMRVGMHCRLWPLRFGAGGFRLNRRLRGRFEPNCLMFIHFTSPAPESGPLGIVKHNDLQNHSFRLMELFSREVVFPG